MFITKLVTKIQSRAAISPETDRVFKPDTNVYLGVCQDRSSFYRLALEQRVAKTPEPYMADLKLVYMAAHEKGVLEILINPKKPWIAKGFEAFFTKLIPVLEELTRYQRETEAKIEAEKSSVPKDPKEVS